MALNFLETFGLTPTEITLYELLLQVGEVPVAKLVSESKLKRPTVYKALQTLEKKGLVEQKDLNKKLHVSPMSPMQLHSLAETQFQTLQRAKGNLDSVITQLNSSYIEAVQKPIVRTYEGVKGLKEIYLDTLIDKKPIFAVLQTAEVEPELYQWLTTVYAPRRARAKVHAKVIVSSGKWAGEYQKQDVKNYRLTRLVTSELFPFQHEVDIYGDKVAFIHFRKDEPLIGVVIKHPHIAQTMKAMFDLAWDGAGTQRTSI